MLYRIGTDGNYEHMKDLAIPDVGNYPPANNRATRHNITNDLPLMNNECYMLI